MNYTHINALSTGASIVKRGARLYAVNINTKGTASNLLSLYDNAAGDNSGNLIAAIDTTANVGALVYEADTLIGLSYVLAAGGAADITIAWE